MQETADIVQKYTKCIMLPGDLTKIERKWIMWLIGLVLGFCGLGYFLKKGVFNSKLSGLERVTYGWLALPVIWMYLFFAIIIFSWPIVLLLVALEDCPIFGLFLLVAYVLFIINAIKRFVSKDDDEEDVGEPKYKDLGDFVRQAQARCDARDAAERAKNKKS